MDRNDRRAFVIFNPASGRGRGARKMARYLSLLEKHMPGCKHATTTRAGEESVLADQAISEGFNLIVAVGGDGTWSNVADQIVASGKDNIALGLLASGTGNDFGRNFGVSMGNPEGSVRTLADGVVRSFDVGRVVSSGTPLGAQTGPHATSKGRYFLNLVGFGFDVAVIEDTAGARFLRGELLYKVTALKNLFSFPGVPLLLEGDGPPVEGEQLMLTISNAPFFGGGFLIAPEARLDDGLLDACSIGNTPAFTRWRLFNAAPKGRHVHSHHVQMRQSARFSVRFSAPPKYEVDGELWQAEGPEVIVEAVPRALQVVVPG
ncbi:MAG: diacylglycerol kinase family lipid kinase [Gemmatimonadetes bacterium]|nr:diacylglycerol kinase family lipid kinase [Gemmatimonadota bacterium]